MFLSHSRMGLLIKLLKLGIFIVTLFVQLFGMLAQIFCGNLTGQVNSYGLHVFFRCLSAVCCAQMYTAGQMICKLTKFLCGSLNNNGGNLHFMFKVSDITSGKPRTIITCLFEQFWSIGVIILPWLASFFTSWSHIYMAISLPTVFLIFALR